MISESHIWIDLFNNSYTTVTITTHFYYSYGGRLPSGSVYQAFGFSCQSSEGKVVDCPYTGAFCDLRVNSDIIAIACLEGGTEPATTSLTAPGTLSGGYQLRLAGGTDRCSGDLEVFVPFLGNWALAVSREFGSNEAAVTCSQLGCGAPLRITRPSRYACLLYSIVKLFRGSLFL